MAAPYWVNLCKIFQQISQAWKNTLVDIQLRKVSSLYISCNIISSWIIQGMVFKFYFYRVTVEMKNTTSRHPWLLFAWFNFLKAILISAYLKFSSVMCMLSWKVSTGIMFISTIVASCIITICLTLKFFVLQWILIISWKFNS